MEDRLANWATNLRRKAFDSCKLSVYIWLLGASLPDSHRDSATEAVRLDLTGGGNFHRPDSLPTLASHPGFATV